MHNSNLKDLVPKCFFCLQINWLKEKEGDTWGRRLQCLSTWPHYFLPLGLLLSLPLQTSYLLQLDEFLCLQHTLRKRMVMIQCTPLAWEGAIVQNFEIVLKSLTGPGWSHDNSHAIWEFPLEENAICCCSTKTQLKDCLEDIMRSFFHCQLRTPQY